MLKEQQEIGETIMSLHERFGKENGARRNKLAKLLEWKGMFIDKWKEFLDNNDVLKESHEQLKDEIYFKEK